MTRVTYTADGGHYRVAGIGFDPGDTKDVDGELADYLRGHEDFDVVDDVAESEGDAREEDGPPEGHLTRYHPSDLTVDEIREKLSEFDYTAADLERLADEERDGKNRTTAIDAIEDRRDELEG